MEKWIWLTVALLFAEACTAEEELAVRLDHAEILRLPAAAGHVIIGNPAVADVTVDGPRLISVFGKAPGVTNLIVLDANDHVLVAKSVVVGRGAAGAVAVHVPGKDGPTERSYACADGRCTRMPAPSSDAAPPPLPAAAAAPTAAH